MIIHGVECPGSTGICSTGICPKLSHGGTKAVTKNDLGSNQTGDKPAKAPVHSQQAKSGRKILQMRVVLSRRQDKLLKRNLSGRIKFRNQERRRKSSTCLEKRSTEMLDDRKRPNAVHHLTRVHSSLRYHARSLPG